MPVAALTSRNGGQRVTRIGEMRSNGGWRFCDTSRMKAIHREDGELCGFVRAEGDTWQALAVFGGLIGTADSERQRISLSSRPGWRRWRSGGCSPTASVAPTSKSCAFRRHHPRRHPSRSTTTPCRASRRSTSPEPRLTTATACFGTTDEPADACLDVSSTARMRIAPVPTARAANATPAVGAVVPPVAGAEPCCRALSLVRLNRRRGWSWLPQLRGSSSTAGLSWLRARSRAERSRWSARSWARRTCRCSASPHRCGRAPDRARSLPLSTVIDVSARMLPTNTEPLPNVAELPTCQNTLHSDAPLINAIELPLLVIRVESVWKMKTALGLFWPSSTNWPLGTTVPSPSRRTRRESVSGRRGPGWSV